MFLSIILWWSFLGCRQFHLQQSTLDFSQSSVDDDDFAYWNWINLDFHYPIELSCFNSFLLMKEDFELWEFIVLHWDIITLQECHQLKQGLSSASSYLVTEFHYRLGHRVLWPLIRSFMSEVLSDMQLQVIWDHFFTSPLRTMLINASAVAFLM